jgi:hypothetical protein
MAEKEILDISKKLNVLIAISLRQLLGNKEFGGKTRQGPGTGDVIRYLSDMGLDAKDIAQIVGSPLQSVRTQLTPNRKK